MNERKPAAEMMRLINGYQVSQAIHVAATLGIADLLAVGRAPATTWPRRRTSIPEPSTGCCARSRRSGCSARATAGAFRSRRMGECLRSDATDPVGPWAAFIGRPYYWQAWAHLLHSVRTGENAFHHVHGADVWEYRAQHPEEGAIFDRAMTGDVARRRRCRRLGLRFLPVRLRRRRRRRPGGTPGRGPRGAPGMRGILFDQPHVVARAEQVLRAAGVADRCQIVAGSFFETVPEGGDAYMLKMILHDWDDAAAIAILRSLPPCDQAGNETAGAGARDRAGQRGSGCQVQRPQHARCRPAARSGPARSSPLFSMQHGSA